MSVPTKIFKSDTERAIVEYVCQANGFDLRQFRAIRPRVSDMGYDVRFELPPVPRHIVDSASSMMAMAADPLRWAVVKAAVPELAAQVEAHVKTLNNGAGVVIVNVSPDEVKSVLARNNLGA